MARQILHSPAKLHVLGDAAMLNIKARIVEVASQRIVFILPLPGAHQPGQPIEGLGIEAQSLSCFACRRASAISNDVCGHRRTQFAVSLINVLNRLLALLSAGQIQIDVRPFAALFRQKALEQQIHANRIDRRDAQCIAHHAVSRRTASLHQNALASAELHNVPHNKKVACKSQLGDEPQFALCLLLRAGQELVIALG